VLVYPSLVQGAEAPAALVAALALAARRDEVDLLILARGGGSLEDLWAFDDERVVRAVAASPIPLLCGVGHETDVTLADFAADLRAPTPTAAAELAAPAQADALRQLGVLAARAQRRVHGRLEAQAQRLDQRALQLARPAQLLAHHAQRLAALDVRRRQALRDAVQRAPQSLRQLALRLLHAQQRQRREAQATLQALQLRLQALDPKRVLGRGYAWVTDAQQRPIVSVRGLHAGQAIVAVWRDGSAQATVDGVQADPDDVA
jgi:exodeoxyribonuclease VII large subunit